jgi:hypothetical protein
MDVCKIAGDKAAESGLYCLWMAWLGIGNPRVVSVQRDAYLSKLLQTYDCVKSMRCFLHELAFFS